MAVALNTKFPNAAGFWAILFAGLLAYGVKAALIEPIAMTALMQVYFKVIEGQEPDPEWEEKLDGVSNKFRELKDKALAHVPRAASAAADAAPAAAD